MNEYVKKFLRESLTLQHTMLLKVQHCQKKNLARRIQRERGVGARPERLILQEVPARIPLTSSQEKVFGNYFDNSSINSYRNYPGNSLNNFSGTCNTSFIFSQLPPGSPPEVYWKCVQDFLINLENLREIPSGSPTDIRSIVSSELFSFYLGFLTLANSSHFSSFLHGNF